MQRLKPVLAPLEEESSARKFIDGAKKPEILEVRLSERLPCRRKRNEQTALCLSQGRRLKEGAVRVVEVGGSAQTAMLELLR